MPENQRLESIVKWCLYFLGSTGGEIDQGQTKRNNLIKMNKKKYL